MLAAVIAFTRPCGPLVDGLPAHGTVIARSAKAGEAVTPISTPKASVAIPKAHSAGKMCRRERWACVAALSRRAALQVNAIR